MNNTKVSYKEESIKKILQFCNFVYEQECRNGNEQLFCINKEEIKPIRNLDAEITYYPFYPTLTLIAEKAKNATNVTDEEAQIICQAFFDNVILNIQTPEVQKYLRRILDVVSAFNPQDEYVEKLSLCIVNNNLFCAVPGREFDVIVDAEAYLQSLRERIKTYDKSYKTCENLYEVMGQECYITYSPEFHYANCDLFYDRRNQLEKEMEYYSLQKQYLQKEVVSMGLCSSDDENYMQTITDVYKQNVENFSNTYKPNPWF